MEHKLISRSLRIANNQGAVAILIDYNDSEIDVILDSDAKTNELG